ncbi:MAG: hypothetical protein ACK4NN_03890 [Rheinheimera sp.]
MHNTDPKSAHPEHRQQRLLLAQTHRLVQCDISTADSTDASQPPQHPNNSRTTLKSRWQQLLQPLKKMLTPALFAMSTLLIPQTQAKDVSISVQGQIQPGVYGHIQVGRPAVTVYQQPVYAQPVYAHPVYQQPQQVYVQPQPVYIQPILVQAPKKHRKHWKKYCHHYGACQHRVQFVEVDYRPRHYEKVYVYHERDRGRREEKRHYHQSRD